MHENTRHWWPFDRIWYWTHNWKNGDASKVPQYVDKFQAWRPLQQRARDGTAVRHKTGGLQRLA